MQEVNWDELHVNYLAQIMQKIYGDDNISEQKKRRPGLIECASWVDIVLYDLNTDWEKSFEFFQKIIKGYKKNLFSLDNSVLSYFKHIYNQAGYILNDDFVRQLSDEEKAYYLIDKFFFPNSPFDGDEMPDEPNEIFKVIFEVRQQILNYQDYDLDYLVEKMYKILALYPNKIGDRIGKAIEEKDRDYLIEVLSWSEVLGYTPEDNEY